jgi:hypothetical protein
MQEAGQGALFVNTAHSAVGGGLALENLNKKNGTCPGTRACAFKGLIP